MTTFSACIPQYPSPAVAVAASTRVGLEIATLNFAEFLFPRTRVNKGKKEGRGCSLLLGGAYNNVGTWERLVEEAECEPWGNF